ncbi:MAG: 1-acyl-sn-glycerol-3-phosphate acyltransferase [Hyphomicrobiaceae bacterium]
MKFPELTYSSPTDPWPKRWTIRTIEHLVGRSYFVPLYERWQREHVAKGTRVIRPMLDLCNVTFDVRGAWPPALDPTAPLVIVANHPFGILDGIGALALAEEIGRPFRILINKDLIKVPEIRAYSLAIDFTETRAAQESNIATRKEALRLLAEGTTIVVYPSGGVATSPTTFGRAVDLPWKTFTARMIQASKAQVMPIYFEGQCQPMFHLVSKFSLTLRLSLMIAELRRRVGSTLVARVGPVVPFHEFKAQKDRIALMQELWERVQDLSGHPIAETRARAERLPGWLRGAKVD